MRRWIARAWWLDCCWIDRVFVGFLLVVGEVELWIWIGMLELQSVVIVVVGYLTLLWCCIWLIVVGFVMFSMWVLFNFVGDDVKSIQMLFIVVLFMGYAMGAYMEGCVLRIVLLVILVGVIVVMAMWEEQVFTDFIFLIAFVLMVWLVGCGVRTRMWLTEELHEVVVQVQEVYEEEIACVVVDECCWIAREMHDVVVYLVSVMVVQVGGARWIFERDLECVVDVVVYIEEVGCAVMAEMCCFFGVMHYGEECGSQLSMRQLDALVEWTCVVGLLVSLIVEGEPRSLPAGMDLVVYCVVQEVLTNAIKHVGAVLIEVIVCWEFLYFELEIVDNGVPKVNGNGGGYGFVGMEECVCLYDGVLCMGC